MNFNDKKVISQTEWNLNRDKMAIDLRNVETHCHYSGLPSVESYDENEKTPFVSEEGSIFKN